jgi:phenylacetate-CoA ligase
LIADNAAKFGVFWESTSGSTGTPLHVIVDRGARSNKLTALIRSYQWAGYAFGKKTFSMQSYYLEDDYEYKKFFQVLRFDSNRFKKDSAVRVSEQINRFKPKFFMGFPFDLLMLGRFAAEEDLSIYRPDSMVVYGETLSAQKRAALEAAYGCRVFDYYSQHECSSMIAECEHHSLHLIDDFSYHEVVDAEGRDASKRGYGELVGTGFYNYAMPLIRYRTRDDIRFDPESTTCPCGRRFTVIKEIVGKQCDYIETPDGRLLGAVMSHSIDHGQGVVVSQCVQDALDHITVNLVVDESYGDASERALESDLRKRLGADMCIDFKIVPQLEKRPGGKTPFILSKIGHDYV